MQASKVKYSRALSVIKLGQNCDTICFVYVTKSICIKHYTSTTSSYALEWRFASSLQFAMQLPRHQTCIICKKHFCYTRIIVTLQDFDRLSFHLCFFFIQKT